MPYESLRIDRDLQPYVAEVVLVGPQRNNLMGPEFWRELPLAFAELDRDPQVRAVLVRGDGRMFSAGLDLMGMAPTFAAIEQGGGLAAPRTDFYDTILAMQAAITAVEECRKPVLAAVHSWCIGGGVDLIAACDIRLASADARFSVREVRMAIVADMGSLQRLPGIIGEGMTRRLALTGEDVDAEFAERIGLVSGIYDDLDALLSAARAMAAGIAAHAPTVVQGVKRSLNAGRDLPRAAALQQVASWNAAFLPSEDFTEAVTAFVEKRDPRFTGR